MQLIKTTFLLALTLAASCGKKEEARQYEYYEPNERQESVRALSDQIGITITIDSNVRENFQMEHHLDRTLRSLKRVQSTLELSAKDLSEIILGTTYRRQSVDGKLILEIDVRSNAATLQEWLNTMVRDEKINRALRLASQKLPLNIVDAFGLTLSTAQDLATKLEHLAARVDFSQDSELRTLYFADQSAIASQGLYINLGLSAEEMEKEILASMDARIAYREKIRQIGQFDTTTLSYQDGVFNADELLRAAGFITYHADAIRMNNLRVQQIILGKRFEAMGMGSDSITLLVDINMNPETFIKKFKSLNMEINEFDFKTLESHVLARFAENGLRLTSFDFSLDRSSFDVPTLKNRLIELADRIDIDLARKAGLRSFRLVNSNPEFYPSTGAFWMAWDSVSSMSDAVNSAMVLDLMDKVSIRMNLHADSLGIPLSGLAYIEQNRRNLESLEAVLRWFKKSMTRQRAREKGLTRMEINESGDCQKSGGTLTIALNTFDTDLIDEIIDQEEYPEESEDTEDGERNP